MKKSNSGPRSSLAERMPLPVLIEEMSLEEQVIDALQCRQGGIKLYPDQAEVLAQFDSADLAGKERMLGSLWPAWKSFVCRP
jgi:hypothetical protein